MGYENCSCGFAFYCVFDLGGWCLCHIFCFSVDSLIPLHFPLAMSQSLFPAPPLKIKQKPWLRIKYGGNKWLGSYLFKERSQRLSLPTKMLLT